MTLRGCWSAHAEWYLPRKSGTSRVQATVSSQSSKSSSYSLTGENEASTIKATGNLYLIATGDDATTVNDGDITITGANIDVAKNLYQSAGNVTYQAATGTTTPKTLPLPSMPS